MNIQDLLHLIYEPSKRIDARCNKYGIKGELDFNIFTSFSETFRRENFHSQILKNILDHSKNGLGTRRVLNNLVNFISKSKSIEFYPFDKEFQVEVEKGKIDILIRDRKKAIIIENKINDAFDQPNQLARYYRYVKDKLGLEVYSIIYIPKCINQKPNIAGYSNEFDDIKPKIIDKLLILPLLNNENDSLSLKDIILEDIENDKNNLANVYCDQYSKLLGHIGGEAMNESDNIEMIASIYSSNKNQIFVNNLMSVWKNKGYYLGKYIQYEIIKKDSDFSDHEYPNAIYKKLDNAVSVAYHTDQSIGFIYSPGKEKISERKGNQLKKILRGLQYDNFFLESEAQWDGEWVWRELDIATYEKTAAQWVACVIEILNEIENDYK